MNIGNERPEKLQKIQGDAGGSGMNTFGQDQDEDADYTLSIMGKEYSKHEIPEGVKLNIRGEIMMTKQQYDHYMEIAKNQLSNLEESRALNISEYSNTDLFHIINMVEIQQSRLEKISSVIQTERMLKSAQEELETAQSLTDTIAILKSYSFFSAETISRLEEEGLNTDPNSYEETAGLRDTLHRMIKNNSSAD